MESGAVHLELTGEQANTLLGVMHAELSEFTSEIANTDNAAYRATLMHRRDVLREVRGVLEVAGQLVAGT